MAFLPQAPSDGIPNTPSDLTTLSDSSLMDIWSELVAWQELLETQVALARIDERAADRAVESAQAKAIVSNLSGKATDRVALAKAKFHEDPESTELLEEQAECHDYRTLVEARAKSIESKIGLISRELTRRTSDPTRSRKSWSTP